MALYAISYDLVGRNRPPEDYFRIATTIVELGSSCSPTDSFWLLETVKTRDQVADALFASRGVGASDHLVIVELTGRGDYYGGPRRDSAVWLDNHMVRV